MWTATRAIVIKDNKILLMERHKFGKHYYTLVGGFVGMGEGKEKALLREVDEETQLHISNLRLTFIEHAPQPFGDQYIYLVDYISGEPEMKEDADEKYINKGGVNIYTPIWMPLSKFREDIPFRSKELKQRIVQGIDQGFPVQVEEFTTTVID